MTYSIGQTLQPAGIPKVRAIINDDNSEIVCLATTEKYAILIVQALNGAN